MPSNPIARLEPLLAPRTVAVVGASARAESAGATVMRNLRALGSDVTVYPVNPRYEEVDGLPCRPSLSALPETVDAVFIGLPAAHGPEIVAEAVACGIPAAVVNAAGYHDSGAEEASPAARLAAAASSGHGLALCGPNNVGFVNVHDRVGLWTLNETQFRPGSTALITQSGSAALVLLGDPRPLALAYVITCGDEAVLTAADYLEHVLADERVETVVMFLETVRDPDRFAAAARRAAAEGKRIVVLKVGRSALGVRAVSAHTGALAGDDEIYRAFFRHHGVTQVEDLDELFETAMLLSSESEPPAVPTALPITLSGGIAAHVADLASDSRLALPELAAETCDRIRTAHPALTPGNPLDAWGLGWDADAFAGVLDALFADDAIGVVAPALSLPASGRGELRMARELAGLLAERAAAQPSGRVPKPVVMLNSNGQGSTNAEFAATLADIGVPCLTGLREGTRAIGHWTRAAAPAPVSEPAPELVRLATLMAAPGAAPAEQARLLAQAGFPMVAEELAADAGEAAAAAERLGFPVVLKGLHPAATHKSELGLVHLDLHDAASVQAAFTATVEALEKAGLRPRDAEIVLQPQVAPGVELVVGIRNDTPFGTVLVVGLGGLHVEVLAEASVRLAPVDRQTALEMLGETPALRLLEGVRGAPPADLDAVVDAVVALSQLGVAGRGVLRSLEVNPLVAHERGKGVAGVDLVVELQPEGAA